MTSSWLERVADRAGVRVDVADAMLRRRGVTPDRPVRPAPSLTIERIFFQGEKEGKATGPFTFEWSDLTSGVWAVASYDNFVGKSSVLEILLWCLRGEPKGLQADVQGWLKAVSVHFSVDDQRYAVEHTLEHGVPSGTISRIRPNGTPDIVDQYTTNDGFAVAMSRFMMATLDLEPIRSRQHVADTEQTVSHGWAALSGALYFGGDHKLLLGDVQWAGLPARMLQMYIGLPWAGTVMQASAAQKEVEQEVSDASRAASTKSGRVAGARERLKGELSRARTQLDGSDAEAVTADKLQALVADVMRLSSSAIELERRQADAEADLRLLQRAADDDERAVRDIRENLVAATFFNGLQPSCCPRCDATVPKERLQHESSNLSCSLCSEPIASDRVEDVSDALAEAEHRRSVSAAALGRATDALKPLKSSLHQVRREQEEARVKLSEAVGGSGFQQRRDAELEVARVEGALREYDAEPNAVTLPDDAIVIEIAHEEAKKAFEDQRGDLLEHLSQEILRLGNAFGVLGLEHVQLNHLAQMRLQKGGQQTTFSKLTAGERLRLRIATAVALLRMGRERGVGRHPGLLIIDSPGAEETNDSDLATLLKELQAVSVETPGLQVLIASANAPQVLTGLGPDRCRIAPPHQFLW